MSNPHNLKVGQKLLQVRPHGINDKWLTIAKVGRKWAIIDNGLRVHLINLHIDGGKYNSPGQCYLSKEDYQQKTELNALWHKLCRHFSSIHKVPCNRDGLLKIAKIIEFDIFSNPQQD